MAQSPAPATGGELHVSFPSYVVAAGVAALGVGFVEQFSSPVAWALTAAILGSVTLVGGPDGVARLAQTITQGLHLPGGATPNPSVAPWLGGSATGTGSGGTGGGPFSGVGGGPVGGIGAAAAAAANQLLGRPYVYGGTSPTAGIDCSGLVQYVFGRLGVTLPRTTQTQWTAGAPVQRDSLQAGDVVFFQNTDGPGITHDGIYLGANKFLHAADEQHGVIISTLTDYWDQHFAGARRMGT